MRSQGVGNLIAKTKPAGNSWAYDYDAANRLTRITSPTGSTRYQYDKNGNRTHQIDALNNTTRSDYDANNLLVALTYPGGDSIGYGYDANGNLTSANYPNLTGMSAVFDALNRLERQDYSDGTALSYDYDANNNVETANTFSGATPVSALTYSYDAFDRQLSALDQYGQLISYSYDLNGNRTRVSSSAGTTRYSFDGLNRLATLTEPAGITQYSYDRTGLPLDTSLPSGIVTRRSYDPQGRLLSLDNAANGATLSGYQYSYDDNGNRLSQIEVNGGAAETTAYEYDAEDRLLAVDYPQARVEYSYDANFNRATETETRSADSVVTKQWAYHYDDRNQLTAIDDLLDAANSISYSYDAKGNQLSKTKAGVVTHFTYNARDQITNVTEAGTSLGDYRYNHQGMRIAKLGERGLERSSYDGKSLLLQTDDNNALLAGFRYGPGLLHSLQAAGSAEEFYLFDGLGSAVTTALADGQVVSRNQFDAWGNKRTESGSSWNRFGFTGHEHDRETGLIYAKARFYDPDTGRFLSHDPWEGDVNVAPSLHRYLYAYQNPTAYVDPDGREPITLTAVAVYTAWAGVNSAFDTTIDYGFHLAMGEGDFKLKETLAVNFAVNMATAGVGNKAKHGGKAVQLAAKLGTDFTGQYAQAKYVEGLSTDEALVSAAVGTVAGEAFERTARAGYKGLKSKFGKQIDAAGKHISDSFNSAKTKVLSGLSRENSGGPNNYILNLDEGDSVVKDSVESLVKYRNAQEIQLNDLAKVGENDRLSIVAHGSPDMISESRLLTAKETGDLLKGYGFKGKNIEMVSCRTGSGPACFAQELADETGAKVTAPRFNVNVLDGIDGVPQVKDPITGELRKPGEFIEKFKPGEGGEGKKTFINDMFGI